MISLTPPKKVADAENPAIEPLLDRLNMGQKSLSTLLDILPVGISIATDVSCKEIRHNSVSAEWLRIQSWDSFSHSDPDPPAVKVMYQGMELLPEEMPIQIAAWQGKEIRDHELEFVWEDGISKTALWNASPLFDAQGNITGAVATFKNITEQKTQGELLKRQASLLDLSAEAIFAWDLNGAITYWNQGAEKMYGFSSEEAVGRVSHDLLNTVHPIEIDDIKSALARDGAWSGEIQRTCKDDRKLIIETRHQVIQDETGTMAVLETNHDITERKRAEQEIRILNEELEQKVLDRTSDLAAANEELTVMNEKLVENVWKLEEEIVRRKESELGLQAAKQKTANILDSISDAFIALDHEWRYTYVNAETQRQLGIPDASEVIGRVVWDVFPNTAPLAYEKYHQAVAEQIPVRFEVFSQITGMWNYVHAYPSPDGLSIHSLDITDLKETQAKLQKSQQDISDILSSITDPFLVLDKEWRITYVNQGWASYLEQTPSELLGQNYLEAVPNALSTDAYKNYSQIAFEKAPIHFESKAPNHDLWFDVNIYPCQDGIAIYARDITVKKKLQQELLDSEERFRTAIENLHDSFGIYTAIRNESGQIEDFLIEYVNEVACKSNCMTRDEQEGKRLLDLCPNYRDNGRFAEFCRVVETGQPHAKDAFIRDVIPDEFEIVDSRIVKLGDGFTAAWRDVTERVQMEEELRNSERQLRLIMDAIPSRMVYVDSEKRYKYVNKAHEEWWGVSGNDTQGKHVWEVIGEEAYHEVQIYIDTALSGERVFYENNLPGRNGEMHYFYNFMVPESDDRGTVNGYILLSNDVTEFKAMEQKIADVLELNQKIVESSPLGIVAYDSSGQVIFANDASARISATTKERILKLNYNDIEAWKPTGIIGIIRQVMETGIPEHEAISYKTVFGKQAWLDCRFSRFTANDKPCLLAVYEDITEKKQMEQQIADALEFNRAIVESSSLGINTYNSSGQCTFINDASAKISGGTRERVLQLNINNLESWKQAGLLDAAKRVLSTGTTEQLEAHFQTSFKKQAWFDCKLSRFTSGGKPHLLHVLEDITERKEAEEALRQSEERFSKVFHSNPCQMAIISLNDYRYLEVNQEWLGAVGISRDEVIGRTIDEVAIFSASQFQKILERTKVRNSDVVYFNRKGKERYGLLSSEIITINGEQCLFGATLDVTERKRYEQEMSRLDRLKLMGQIAGGIAHEIRNPMTVVRGYLQLMQDKEEFASQHKRFDTMIGEIDRANAIITEFLSLAKDKPEEMKRQNINDIVTVLVPLIQADVAKNQVAVSVDLAEVPDLNLDEKEIRQVVLNLVRNGVESMPQGGELTIKTSKKKDRVILSIKDQGNGIPPGVLEKLGTPFFTTKDTGTGLGLSICYRIAESHNARIEVKTGKRGTTFTVSFPITSDQDGVSI